MPKKDGKWRAFQFLILVIGGLAVVRNSKASWTQPIIAYYPGYNGNANIASIPWPLITEVNIAFAGIDPNGNCGWFNPDGSPNSNANTLITAINSVKSARSSSSNPNAKIVLSVGGAGASGFSKAAAKAPSQLAQSCFALMNQYGLDGIDYDWEYPGFFSANACPTSMSPCSSPNDTANFTALLSATKSLLNGKILSAALYVTTTKYYVTYDYAGLDKNLTYANIMAYDMAFPTDSPNTTGYNANFTTAEQSLQYFASQGVSENKLILGVPFYSYRWSNISSPGGLGQRGSNPNSYQFSYSQVNQIWGSDSSCALTNNPNGSNFYCSGSGTHAGDWVSYDPPALMRAKGSYVAQNGYGGLMFWLVGQDDSKNSLSTAARYGLSEGAFAAVLQ